MGIEPVPGQGQASSVGIEPVPGTVTGLQRRYVTYPWDRGHVSFDFSLSQWDRFGTGSVLVPCACTKPVPPFQSWHLTKSRILSKSQRGPTQISEISIKTPQKSVSNWSKIETENRENFH